MVEVAPATVVEVRACEPRDLRPPVGVVGRELSGVVDLLAAATVRAAVDRRSARAPEDVRAVCHDVLRHRIGLTYEAEAENITTEQIITDILNNVIVP